LIFDYSESSLSSLFAQESTRYRSENLGESYIGSVPSSPPLPPLPKDTPPPNYDRLQSQPSQSTISASQLAHMTAVERSEVLRVARTEPYLQVSPVLVHRVLSLMLLIQSLCADLY